MTNLTPAPNPTNHDSPLRDIANDIATQTQWLVSVRSESEFVLASKYAVDIIDFKEPLRGPLSPADPALWDSVCETKNALKTPMLSAALGECDEMRLVASRVPASFDFAKVGPSGCDSRQKLNDLWTEVADRLPATVELVAVAYGDYEEAGCLPPEEVFRLAAEKGIRRCLLDTFRKNGQSIIEAFGMQNLQRLSTLAEEHQLWWTLAGSIKLHHLQELTAKEVSPNCLGVRGDVCEQARTTSLSGQRMQIWSDAIKQQ